MEMNGITATIAPIQTGSLPKNTPEFIRLPKPGTLCAWTGLSRSKLNELILPSRVNGFKPPVRSVSLRNRGQTRGTRLIVFESLVLYLRGLLEQQEDANGGGDVLSV
jgi:hypothetical protein